MLWGTFQVTGWNEGHLVTEVTAGHIAIVASTDLRAASQLSRDLLIVLESLSHVLTGRGRDTFHLTTTSVAERYNSCLEI